MSRPAQLPATLEFQGTSLSVINVNGKPWLSAADLGRALGYGERGDRSDPSRSVRTIYTRYDVEFTAEMSAVIETPTAGGSQKTRIFSSRGAHLIAMIARTKRAAAFRRWVLDVLEGVAQPSTLAESSLDHRLRAEARGMAVDYFDRCRAMLPAGSKLPTWNREVDQRLADAIALSAVEGKRWLLAFGDGGRVRLTSVSQTASIVEGKSLDDMRTLFSEYVPIDLLPPLMEIGLQRLSYWATKGRKN